ncbi:MAG: uracil-DNA glycosylase family protein [Geminicoccaceae bacterium]
MALVSEDGNDLINEVKACRICASKLAAGPRPVVQIGCEARLLIAGQAPGKKVHETGIPFDDPSGETLRAWLGIDRTVFYDPRQVAILPMAFCYPGRGRSGDLPPPPECARHWRARLLATMPKIRLKVVIGRYAQDYHLGSDARPTLTETVRAFEDYLPSHIPLPHPSPRNRPWLKRHPWFEAEVLPALRNWVTETLS